MRGKFKRLNGLPWCPAVVHCNLHEAFGADLQRPHVCLFSRNSASHFDQTLPEPEAGLVHALSAVGAAD